MRMYTTYNMIGCYRPHRSAELNCLELQLKRPTQMLPLPIWTTPLKGLVMVGVLFAEPRYGGNRLFLGRSGADKNFKFRLSHLPTRDAGFLTWATQQILASG